MTEESEKPKKPTEIEQAMSIIDGMKVNMYQLAKAVVFHAIRTTNPDEDIKHTLIRTDAAIDELMNQEDMKYKKRMEAVQEK